MAQIRLAPMDLFLEAGMFQNNGLIVVEFNRSVTEHDAVLTANYPISKSEVVSLVS